MNRFMRYLSCLLCLALVMTGMPAFAETTPAPDDTSYEINIVSEDTTPEPSGDPTEEPTEEPPEEPTGEPTEEPTPEPTEEPTPEPTAKPPRLPRNPRRL